MIIFSLILCFICIVVLSKKDSSPAIKVAGTKLYVNNQPYEMKFVGYGSLRQQEFPSQWGICICDRQQFEASGPNPYHCLGENIGEFDMGRDRIDYDLGLIKGIDANGIRTWSEVNQDLLDSAQERGLMVAAGLELPWSDKYGQADFEKGVIKRVIAHVKQYKHHPSVLAWIMGNEIEINIKPSTVPAYFAFLEKLAKAIKAEDSNHPVTTAVAYVPTTIETYDKRLPTMDFWSVNIYFNPKNPGWSAKYASLSRKPLFVSEFGTDAFRHSDVLVDFNEGTEDETWHADINGHMANVIRNEVARNYSNNTEARTVGGAYFLFVDQDWQPKAWDDACYQKIEKDGWHGPNDYQDLEFFGIYKNTPTATVSHSVTPRPLAKTLKNIW